MKASVNEDCIGCGLCESTAPEVFAIGDDGLAHAIEEEVPEAAEDAAQEACDGCPVTAIELDQFLAQLFFLVCKPDGFLAYQASFLGTVSA